MIREKLAWTFLARIFQDWGIRASGIACEEYTAVCIDQNGIAKIYGDHPNYDDYAYFISINCNITNPLPEICQSNTPLTWDFSDSILNVYVVPGTMNGTNTFDLSNWVNGTGGNWENWSINQGVLLETNSTQPNCNLELDYSNSIDLEIDIYPNPAKEFIHIKLNKSFEFHIYSMDHRLIKNGKNVSKISLENMNSGIYNIVINSGENVYIKKIVIQ